MNRLGRYIGVLACDRRGAIGYRGKIPWDLPAEKEHYRQIVQRAPLIMGYKTYLSMPKKALADRRLIVFSRIHQIPAVQQVFSWEKFVDLELPYGYMIGGAQIAQLFLEKNALQEFYLTILRKQYPGDVFFPIESLQKWPSRIHFEHPDFTVYHYENCRHPDPSRTSR